MTRSNIIYISVYHIKSVKYVIEVDTFITLNIPTDTKKGLGQKIPTPSPSQRVELKTFFCVTRDLIEELGKTNRLPSRSSRSSTIIPCAITPNSRQVWGCPHISGRNKQNDYHNLIVHTTWRCSCIAILPFCQFRSWIVWRLNENVSILYIYVVDWRVATLLRVAYIL